MVSLVSATDLMSFNRLENRYHLQLEERSVPTDQEVEAKKTERLVALLAQEASAVSADDVEDLRKVADALNEVLQKDPSETFLIEGHTDAVGSDQSNLVLSDQRAESVANVLSDVYGIPPENMATQGYGERYLKVNTAGPNQENRRVTIRRVTPLVRPVASNN